MVEVSTEKKNEILVLENLNPVDVYNGGMKGILERMQKDARSLLLDASTEKGRKDIASYAYKIARSKTLLDEMGKELGEEARKNLAKINSDRKLAVDTLDELKTEIRKPLTDFEEAEKTRIEDMERMICRIENCGLGVIDDIMQPLSLCLKELTEKIVVDSSWKEFEARGRAALNASLEKINLAIDAENKRISEQAELERLRKAEAERIQLERDEALKKEAAEKARKEAEEKADRERKELEAKQSAAIAAQKAAEERAIAEAKAAEARAKKAENDRIAAEAKAKADAQAARERAEREKQEAVEAERKRAEEAQKAAEEAARVREANVKHHAKINNEALTALLATGLSEDAGKAVIEAIARGKVPHVKISY